MAKDQPSRTEIMKRLTRGAAIVLPSGRAGVFLEFFKGSKASAWVLDGGMDGPKVCASVDGILKQTWGWEK